MAKNKRISISLSEENFKKVILLMGILKKTSIQKTIIDLINKYHDERRSS